MRRAALLLALALALGVTACGDKDKDRQGSVQPQGDELVLTLGTKNFTESVIVGELYRQVLRTRGINVRLRKEIGPTEKIDR
jgi:osmoprotectant transport system substrate-binding protein